MDDLTTSSPAADRTEALRSARDERWRTESSFFDAQAARREVAPLDPRTLQRYSENLRPRFFKDFRIQLLGPLKGKRILDVGCGDGVNAVLLAKLGADVTGIDISPGAIALARQKAEVDGLTANCRFLCGPAEEMDLPRASFDIIWGDAILHHIISDLPALMRNLCAYAKPGGLLVFGEPVSLSQRLRNFRLKLPIKLEGTPDERPLEQPEIDLVRGYLPDLKLHYFTVLSRLNRFVLKDWNYERSSWMRQRLVDFFAFADQALLSIPMMQSWAGQAVIYGHPAPVGLARAAGSGQGS